MASAQSRIFGSRVQFPGGTYLLFSAFVIAYRGQRDAIVVRSMDRREQRTPRQNELTQQRRTKSS